MDKPKRPKTGGRAKGTPNKVTRRTRELFSAILIDNQERVQEELDKLEGKDFITVYIEMAEFVLPKRSRVEHDVDEETKQVLQGLQIEFIQPQTIDITPEPLELPPAEENTSEDEVEDQTTD